MRKLNQQQSYSPKHCQVLALGSTLLAMAGLAYADTVVNTYDALNRLTRVQSDNGTVIEYAYDNAGNRASRTVTQASLPPNLSVLISAKTGTQNARIWTTKLSNSGLGPAVNAMITAFNLTQSYGAACTPTITSPASFPLPVGSISPQSSASTQITINFNGCVSTAKFNATIGISSNNGSTSSSKTFTNQFR